MCDRLKMFSHFQKENLPKYIKALSYISLVFCISTIAGCRSYTQEKHDNLVAAQGTCQSYGFKPGTDAYASCIQQLDYAWEQQDTARRMQMMQTGLKMMTESPRPASKTLNCTQTGSSSMMNQTYFDCQQ